MSLTITKKPCRIKPNPTRFAAVPAEKRAFFTDTLTESLFFCRPIKRFTPQKNKKKRS
jgi:hypothetical protein